MSSEEAPERLHPLATGLFAAQQVRRWAGALIPLLVGVGAGVGLLASLGLLAAGTMAALVLGALEWRAYTFGVERSSFVVRRGVVGRDTVSVPLTRVQSVDIAQSATARLVGARALTVRTAAGSATLHLPAVSERAERRLREALGEAGVQPGAGEEVVRRLPASRLPLIALTSPRIGAGIGVLVALFYRLDDIVPGDLAGKLAPRLEPGSLVVAAAELALVVALALAAALIGATLSWAGFRVVRDGPRLRLRRGLLSLRETVIPFERVRAVEVREGLVREALGLCSLRIRTAGRAREGAQSGVLFPLLARREAAGLVRATVPAVDLEGVSLRRPPSRARGRAMRRRALPALALATAATLLAWPYGLAVLVAVPVAALLGVAQLRTAGVGLAGGRLRWRHRALARSTLVASARSIQWRRVRQGPLQRRRELATLEVGLAVAGAHARVADLDAGDAVALARALGSAESGRQALKERGAGADPLL